MALAMWRRFMVRGPEKYGEVYYLGTVPMPGHEELVHALVATHDVLETRFLFDPNSGLLLAMEMFPDSQVDPCEVYFDDYQDVDGRQLPHRLRVRFGDEVFAIIQLQQIMLDSQQGGET